MAKTQMIQEELLGRMENFEQNQQWQADILASIYERSWRANKRDDVVEFSTKLSGMAKAQRAEELQSRIVARLRFHGMSDRRARIPDAHQDTFEWIYRDSAGSVKPWASFVKWLTSNDSLYWITGKPGSGKSTLMKFIHANPRTWQYLKTWSGSRSLVTAGFFFWNSGSEMQMSSIGLLQTLLFKCLSQRADFVPRVFPDRWQSTILFGEDLHPWSWSELHKGFQMFTAEAVKKNKLFFFIDGLDEFNGKHQELISLIQDISKLPNLKICLSSRPWLVFEDAFGTSPSLVVQDLTFPDIKIYVQSRLFGNPRFCQLREREPQSAAQLVKEITGKSAGVFLWIRLVVDSLLEGLTNSDRASDLARRLERMPEDLDELYKKILDHLDQFYFEHASQLFQIVRQSENSLSLLELSFADEEDPETAIRAEIGPLNEADKEYRCDAMKRRLNSRCKGLLEVPALQPKSEKNRKGLVNSVLDSDEPIFAPDDLANLKVEYLHRTVRDFLQKPDVWNFILSATKPSFDPRLSLARGFLMRLKEHDADKFGKLDDNMWRTVALCWRYANEAEIDHDGSQTPLLQELDRVASLLKTGPNGDDDVVSESKKVVLITKGASEISYHTRQNLFMRGHGATRLSFQEQCILYIDVQSQMKSGQLFCQDNDGRPILTLAVLEFEPFAVLRLRLIRFLLQHGVDPNQKYHHSTPWRDAICTATMDSRLEHKHPYHNLLMGRWAEVIELFIVHGANVEIDHKAEEISCLREAFWRWNPEKTKYLEGLARAHMVMPKKFRLSKLFSHRNG